jgi:hypothetical protein
MASLASSDAYKMSVGQGGLQLLFNFNSIPNSGKSWPSPFVPLRLGHDGYIHVPNRLS